MRKIERKSVTTKAVREMLADPSWQISEELSQRVGRHDRIALHPDGRVLMIFSNGRGGVYPTRAEFDHFIAAAEEAMRRGHQHILKGRLLYGEDFIDHIADLINELANRLALDMSQMDKTFQSLVLVDAKVKRMGRKKAQEPPVFSGLVAYVGEVMRLDIQGKWVIVRVEPYGSTIWEPWIEDAQGRRCNSWSFLYDMLIQGKAMSLAGAAHIELNFRR